MLTHSGFLQPDAKSGGEDPEVMLAEATSSWGPLHSGAYTCLCLEWRLYVKHGISKCPSNTAEGIKKWTQSILL